MDLLHPQLTAFLAVLDEGGFEAAARRLSVTASAVSQRIKALEDRLGQVLVVRVTPARPTPAGERLLRHVRPMQTLEADAIADILPSEAGTATQRTIAIAVNDDSLATWLLPALASLHGEHSYLFDVRVDDQDHTLALLRDGSVLGAISSQAAPLQGCNAHGLGAMRYRAVASPALAAKYFADGIDADALSRAPMLVFNRKDELQARFIRRITRAHISPPVNYLPSATGFVDAATLGLGWCLAPEMLIERSIRSKKLVVVDREHWVDVPLYWQHAAVRSTLLENVGRALRKAARSALH